MGGKWIFDPPGRLVRAGESILHLQISGSGPKVVVLEAGIAATSLSWSLLQPGLSKIATVVSYDRAGLGWSGPAITPRTPAVIATELRHALEAAGLKGPYVLVGHSFGGLIVQRFATLYKDDVSGLVLVDALRPAEFHPMDDARKRTVARGVRLSRRGAMLARIGVVGASLRILLAGNRMLPRLAARITSGTGGSGVTNRLAGEIRKLPRELWPVIAWQWSQPKNFEGMARHLEDLPESAAEILANRLDISVPVIAMLAAGASDEGLSQNWKISRVDRSGHWIQLDQPLAIQSAIETLLAM